MTNPDLHRELDYWVVVSQADLTAQMRRQRQWSMQSRGPQLADGFGIDFEFDGGGLPLVPPLYMAPVEVPLNCRVVGARIFVGMADGLAKNLSSATFNVSRGTFLDYPSLTLLHDQVIIPTLTGALKADVLNTTSWTTKQLFARDILVCQLATCSGTTGSPIQITLSLLLRKTPALIVQLNDNSSNPIIDSSGNLVLWSQ